jgi:hypothetical protein
MVVPVGSPGAVYAALLEDVNILAARPERIKHSHIGFSDGLLLAFEHGFHSAACSLIIDKRCGGRILGLFGAVCGHATRGYDQKKEGG